MDAPASATSRARTTRTCSTISHVSRLRAGPCRPVAQNAHASAQPTCELTHTEKRPGVLERDAHGLERRAPSAVRERVLHERVELARAARVDTSSAGTCAGARRTASRDAAPDARARRRTDLVAVHLGDHPPRLLDSSSPGHAPGRASAGVSPGGEAARERGELDGPRQRTCCHSTAPGRRRATVRTVFGFSFSELVVVVTRGARRHGPEGSAQDASSARPMGRQDPPHGRRSARPERHRRRAPTRASPTTSPRSASSRAASSTPSSASPVIERRAPTVRARRTRTRRVRDDFYVVRDREYPRDGADAYGALPDNAIVYTEGLPKSALARDPLYVLGDAEAELPPEPEPEPRPADREPIVPATRRRATPRRRIGPPDAKTRSQGADSPSERADRRRRGDMPRTRELAARRSRGRREDDDLGAHRRAPQAASSRAALAPPRAARSSAGPSGSSSSAGSRSPTPQRGANVSPSS